MQVTGVQTCALPIYETVARGETFHGTAVNYRKDGSAFEMEWKVAFAGSDEDADYYLAVQREAK